LRASAAGTEVEAAAGVPETLPLAQEVKLASLRLPTSTPAGKIRIGTKNENEDEDKDEDEDVDVDCGAVYLKCLVESVLKYIKKFTAAMARIEFMRIW